MTTKYEIGQKVVYQNTVCTVCKPENNEGYWVYWIDNPERGYKHGVSKDSIKPYGAEPIKYKPDWDSIPKEFKYCYYFAHALTEGDRQLILSVNPIPRHDKNEHMKRADRPAPLVDGAWYAVTLSNAVNSKLVVRWNKSSGLFSWIGIAGISYAIGDLTIHNRIPDELWNNN